MATVNDAEVEVITNSDGSFTIPTATAGDVIRLVPVQKPDAVTSVTAAPQPSDQCYNLSGIAVNPSQHKGIYIVKGQKRAAY